MRSQEPEAAPDNSEDEETHPHLWRYEFDQNEWETYCDKLISKMRGAIYEYDGTLMHKAVGN